MTGHVTAQPTPAITIMSAPARLAAALPDAVTAGFFLIVWLAPMALGESAVRNAMLIMLVEFLVVHASGFLGGFAFGGKISRFKRVLAMLGFSMFYLGFVAAFALVFNEWWPLPVFGWLLLGKFAGALSHRAPSAEQSQRMIGNWGLGVLFYIGGVFLTLLLPMPRLGLTLELQPAFGLPGSGLWVDQPQRVIAFGVLYFGLCAWSKWRDWAGAGGPSLEPKR